MAWQLPKLACIYSGEIARSGELFGQKLPRPDRVDLFLFSGQLARMAIWLRGSERWYLVLGGVAVGRGFEPQSDLELFFAEILINRK
jgi:hypothetical protein